MVSPQPYARIGGALYLIIITGGVFAEAFVRGKLVVSGNPEATAANITGAQFLWRSGFACELVMLVCDVAVAMILYALLRPVSRNLALLGAFFRLVQVAISSLNGLNHLAALFLLTGAPYVHASSPEQLHAAALFALRLQSTGYDIALVFFGIDCLIIGYLIVRSTYLPQLLGVLMAVAGVCYLLSSFASLISPGFASVLYSHAILLPPFISETSLALWLLVIGVNVPRWSARITDQEALFTRAASAVGRQEQR